MSEGWVKLHRCLMDNPIWNKKPFSPAHAWIYLILKASHKENEFLLGNEVIKCEKGQFITSELRLMRDWGWSKTKVRAFLKLIADLKMIDKKTDQKKTTLTLLNYCTYQDCQTTKEPQKNHGETAERPQKDTIKNVKNEKNVKNVKKFIIPTLDEVRAYCLERGNSVDPQRWMDYYTSKGWKVGQTPMKDWKAAVRTWEHNDYGPKQQELAY